MGRDEAYMRMAIDLAKKAEGLTSPNPVVGAVIVKSGKVIGGGYHKTAGSAHAEINALKRARLSARGAALYVTLEPCGHYGRTPPCTDAIIKSGIKKVIIGVKDPNPINNGRGIRKLRNHGIKVKTGVLEKESLEINRPYIKFITKKMPYVTIKVAESLDGKTATRTGDSRWITAEDSRQYVHELRAKVDAVMVGVNTVIRDDPRLTNRLKPGSGGKQPLRIIVDSRLKTPLKARIFSSIRRSPVLIATTKRSAKIGSYERLGARVAITRPKDGMVDLKEFLKRLAQDGVVHIMAEGGGELTAGLIKEGLVDRFLFFISPKIIGGRLAKTSVEGEGVAKVKDAFTLKDVMIRKFKEDILVEAGVK